MARSPKQKPAERPVRKSIPLKTVNVPDGAKTRRSAKTRISPELSASYDRGKKDAAAGRVSRFSNVEELIKSHFQSASPELSSRLPLPQILAEAPEDDEPLTPEEIAAIQEGLDDLERGDLISDEELVSQLEASVPTVSKTVLA